MYVDNLVIEFWIYSVLGWLFESWYAVMRTGHWKNRGFLFGPVCPIYGCGSILITLMYDYHVLKRFDNLWKLYLVFMIGSAILEYITSFIMEMTFHARWWNYSSMPLNLNGRICLPASAAFGVIGIFLIQTVIPQAQRIRLLSPIIKHTATILISMIFGADIALSTASMGQLLTHLRESEAMFEKNMDSHIQAIRNLPQTTVSVFAAKIMEGQTKKDIRLLQKPNIGERYHLHNVIFIKRKKGNKKMKKWHSLYVAAVAITAVYLSACDTDNVKTETFTQAVATETAATIETEAKQEKNWKNYDFPDLNISLKLPDDMQEIKTQNPNIYYFGGNNNISVEVARWDQKCENDINELHDLVIREIINNAKIVTKNNMPMIAADNTETKIHYFLFGKNDDVYYIWAASNEMMNDKTDLTQAADEIETIDRSITRILPVVVEDEPLETEAETIGPEPEEEETVPPAPVAAEKPVVTVTEPESKATETITEAPSTERKAAKLETIPARAQDEMPVDYGRSKIYSREEIDNATAVMQKEFSTWAGCKLHSIHYGGDDSNTAENINWLNSLKDGKEYTECMLILTDFHSPENASGAWDPDSEYMNYQWWLARESGGDWELVNWGY